MLRRACIILLLCLIGIGPFNEQAGAADVSGNAQVEYKLKTAFILNFAKFITWPESAFTEDSETFFVCVLQDDPIVETLSALENRTIGKRKIQVHRINSLKEVTNECNLLFIGAEKLDRFTAMRSALQKHHIVTVSDGKGFVLAGGIIEFVTQDDKLAFKINLGEARKEELNIHSSLLNLASEVIQ